MSEERNENGNPPEVNSSDTAADSANSADKASSPQADKPIHVAAPQAPVNASPDEAAKAPAAAAKLVATETAETPVIPAGVTGRKLDDAKLNVRHLGSDATGNEMIDVAADDLLRVATYLRDQCQFDLLLSCSGIDWKDRLESVYFLYATKTSQYVSIKVTAVDGHSPSLVPVWNAADWHERESYDLLGIIYDGHPNLCRILMPDDWLGHPLRKDYKVDDPRLVWNER
jgi:NADH-quinone oxidoreductase subunit C